MVDNLLFHWRRFALEFGYGCLGHSKARLSNQLCNAMIPQLPELALRLEHQASPTMTRQRTDPLRQTREA